MVSKEEIDECPDVIEKRKLIKDGKISPISDVEKILSTQSIQPFIPPFASKEDVETFIDVGIEFYIYNPSNKLIALYCDEILAEVYKRKQKEINVAYA